MRFAVLMLAPEHPPLAAHFDQLGRLNTWSPTLAGATAFKSREAAEHMYDQLATEGYAPDRLVVVSYDLEEWI